MCMTDPIADLLTQIRNSLSIRRSEVTVSASKTKISILEILKQEGFIEDFEILPGQVQNQLCIKLRYGPEGEMVIRKIRRVSKPGCRKYRGVSELKKICNGQGISVVSTNRGVMSDRVCRKANIGGEVLLEVW